MNHIRKTIKTNQTRSTLGVHYEYFEKALELDPKVGVKRQYNKLKKELKVN